MSNVLDDSEGIDNTLVTYFKILSTGFVLNIPEIVGRHEARSPTVISIRHQYNSSDNMSSSSVSGIIEANVLCPDHPKQANQGCCCSKNS
jgi:hypothetical protein